MRRLMYCGVFVLCLSLLSGCALLKSPTNISPSGVLNQSGNTVNAMGPKPAPDSPQQLERAKAVMGPVLAHADALRKQGIPIDFGLALPYGQGDVGDYVSLNVRRVGLSLYDAETGSRIGSLDASKKTGSIHYCRSDLPAPHEITCWTITLKVHGKDYQPTGMTMAVN